MAAVTSIGETPLAAPAKGTRGMQAGRRRRLNLFRYLVFMVFGLFFLLPLLAMVRFSLEGSKLGTWSLAAWRQIVSYPGPPPLVSAVEITLELAVITSVVMLVLLVPTMIWVRLRVQWISRTFEFLCLLPLTIPAIVLVVGLAPIYNRIRHYQLSALQLFWAYVILALPYAYRALSAGLGSMDVTTLSEAARSLGASWFTVIVRVIAPNMRQAILNALLLTIGAGAGRVHHRLPAALHQPAGGVVFHQPEHAECLGDLLHVDCLAAVRLYLASDPVLRRPPPPRPGMRYRT